jgi:hypothetical protein
MNDERASSRSGLTATYATITFATARKRCKFNSPEGVLERPTARRRYGRSAIKRSQAHSFKLLAASLGRNPSSSSSSWPMKESNGKCHRLPSAISTAAERWRRRHVLLQSAGGVKTMKHISTGVARINCFTPRTPEPRFVRQMACGSEWLSVLTTDHGTDKCNVKCTLGYAPPDSFVRRAFNNYREKLRGCFLTLSSCLRKFKSVGQQYPG